MAKINTKIIYDKEEDILYLSKERKVKASIEIGDFILDVDMDDFISGIEILNASENLDISPEYLESIQKASMQVTYKPNYAHILLVFAFKDKEIRVPVPLTIDLGHGEVKTEKTEFVSA